MTEDKKTESKEWNESVSEKLTNAGLTLVSITGATVLGGVIKDALSDGARGALRGVRAGRIRF